MTDTVKIIALAGSNRKQSFNRSILQAAVDGAETAGAEVTRLDLRDYPLPLFDEDLESAEGLPQNVIELKRLFRDHPGMLLACPEYNSSITPLLKNTIDWISRPMQGEARLAGFQDKVVTLMSASAGALGGLRGLVHVRAILGNIGCIVLPGQLAVSNVDQALDDDGRVSDPDRRAQLQKLGANTVETVKKLHA